MKEHTCIFSAAALVSCKSDTAVKFMIMKWHCPLNSKSMIQGLKGIYMWHEMMDADIMTAHEPSMLTLKVPNF